MNYIKIKLDDNNNPIIEDNFEFEISETIINSDMVPVKKISFYWTPESPSNLIENDNLYNNIGEKLKQDFIKLLKNK